MTTEHTVEETHLADEGLWIPPELREFSAQIVFRTPKATIQHFQSGGGQLDGYYGMIDEGDFGDHEEMRDPQNPELAPNKVSIKPQGEDVVVLEVDLEPDLLADGGEETEDTGYCDRCEEERETTPLYRDGHVWVTLCEECHDALAEEIASFDGENKTRSNREEWEKHNESFNYSPPNKDPELWSSSEWTELYDRAICRRVKWVCQKCNKPCGTLQKARSHVQKQHNEQLVSQVRAKIDTGEDGEKEDETDSTEFSVDEDQSTLADGGWSEGGDQDAE